MCITSAFAAVREARSCETKTEDYLQTHVKVLRSAGDGPVSFAILGKVGTRYVLFHLNMYDARSRERLIERLGTYAAYLRPLVQEGDVWLFEIVGFPN